MFAATVVVGAAAAGVGGGGHDLDSSVGNVCPGLEGDCTGHPLHQRSTTTTVLEAGQPLTKS